MDEHDPLNPDNDIPPDEVGMDNIADIQKAFAELVRRPAGYEERVNCKAAQHRIGFHTQLTSSFELLRFVKTASTESRIHGAWNN